MVMHTKFPATEMFWESSAIREMSCLLPIFFFFFFFKTGLKSECHKGVGKSYSDPGQTKYVIEDHTSSNNTVPFHKAKTTQVWMRTNLYDPLLPSTQPPSTLLDYNMRYSQERSQPTPIIPYKSFNSTITGTTSKIKFI